MNTTQQRPWYREPLVWLLIGIPLTSVIGGISMLFLAGAPPELVSKDDHAAYTNVYRASHASVRLQFRNGQLLLEFGAPVTATHSLVLTGPAGSKDVRIAKGMQREAVSAAGFTEFHTPDKQTIALPPVGEQHRVDYAY